MRNLTALDILYFWPASTELINFEFPIGKKYEYTWCKIYKMLLAGWMQAAFEDTFKGLYGIKIVGICTEGKEIIELKTFKLKIIYK